MKIKWLNILLFIFLTTVVYSQSDEDLVRYTIQNYFSGTSYNYLNLIDSAFYPEAELYLENRQGELMKISPEEYKGFFVNKKAGEFNGRYNKLLSIAIEGNLAQVKAEILIPAIKRRYIDVFLVREMSPGKWRIVSKAANSSDMEGG